jgi:hypothetical protein
MAEPTTACIQIFGAIASRWRARWNRDFRAAEANGWTVERGRLGRLSVRDPRFDLIQECSDCGGTSVDRPPQTAPCSGCQRPCPTCQGRGTVRGLPLANLSAVEDVPSFGAAGGRHA